MRKRVITATFALVGLGSFVVLGNSPEFVGNLLESIQKNPVTKLFSPAKKIQSEKIIQIQSNTKGREASEKIPVQVTYLFLFRQLTAFEEKAREVESQGKDGSEYRDFYQRLANLTGEQSESLTKTAVECAAELKIKDEAAKQIGDRLRAEYQAQLSAGTAPPVPPLSAELAELQKQRDEIILKYRDSLKADFGEAFPQFESFVTAHITSNITTNMRDNAISPPSNMNRLTDNPQIQDRPSTENKKEDDK